MFAFQRGGSTLLLDLLLSHPQVCRTAGELHMVFRGRGRAGLPRRMLRRALADLPVRVLTGSAFFDPRNLVPRPRLQGAAAAWVDLLLYRSRFGVTQPAAPGRDYERSELAGCRLASKGVGGTVFTCEPLLELYPDATVFLLVRNGLALSEGRVRRGADAADVAREYVAVASEMLRLDAEHAECRLLRFEDLAGDPARTLEVSYEHAGLSEISEVRLRRQPTATGTGLRWYPVAELASHVSPDRDRAQIAALSAQAQRSFLDVAGDVMGELGYAA